VVTHHSTNWAITSLTSEIRRDLVRSSMYGRSWFRKILFCTYSWHKKLSSWLHHLFIALNTLVARINSFNQCLHADLPLVFMSMSICNRSNSSQINHFYIIYLQCTNKDLFLGVLNYTRSKSVIKYSNVNHLRVIQKCGHVTINVCLEWLFEKYKISLIAHLNVWTSNYYWIIIESFLIKIIWFN
jgi:hypothetical protein